MALSRLLEKTLKGSTARDYQRGFAEYLANIPETTGSRCNGDGQVRGLVELPNPAQAEGIPKAQPFPTTLPPMVQCRACDGTGIKSRRKETVPFSEENVERFAKFLRDCGGFCIW